MLLPLYYQQHPLVSPAHTPHPLRVPPYPHACFARTSCPEAAVGEAGANGVTPEPRVGLGGQLRTEADVKVSGWEGRREGCAGGRLMS